VVGFGAGYYYAHETTLGLAFSALDVGLLAGLVASDETGLQWGLGAGLLASHIWQGLDGVSAAGRDQRRHGLPFGIQFTGAGAGSWSSGRWHEFDTAGGASRDLAWTYQALAATQPAFTLRLGLADASVGVSYRTHF